MISGCRMARPEGLDEVYSSGTTAWVRPEARRWVEEALRRSGSLYEQARAEAGGETVLAGRAPVYVVASGPARWVVRHYVRGGSVASFLGDRYLRSGCPRPLRAAGVSELLRREGVPTPRVVAAAVYGAGAFYRGDLVTEHIGAGRDLARLLFLEPGEDVPSKTLRIASLEAAAALVAMLSSRGFVHPDLNVKNFLVEPGSPPRVHLLDLDRCRSSSGPFSRRRMRRRFRASLSKWERRSGIPLPADEWKAVERGWGSASMAS
jgi:3-deoxy-D-manno-octulosonic acid kinase